MLDDMHKRKIDMADGKVPIPFCNSESTTKSNAGGSGASCCGQQADLGSLATRTATLSP